MERAFTLTELLITMMVLAALAVVAVPAYQEVRVRARLSSIKAILETVRTAIAVYRDREITAGRSDGSSGNRGYSSYGQVRDIKDSTTTPKVLEDQNMPDNPFASDPSMAHTNSNPDYYDNVGLAATTCPGTAGQVEIGGSSDTMAWCYNQTTGRFWANTNVSGSGAKACGTPDQSENCL